MEINTRFPQIKMIVGLRKAQVSAILNSVAKITYYKERGRDYDSEKIFYEVSRGDGTFSCYHSHHGFYPDRIYPNSRS